VVPRAPKARKNISAAFEGGQMPIHMRLPKLKGFRNRSTVEFQVVNLDRLAELFPQGGEVGPAELGEAGAVRKGQPVKVLGTGELGGVKLRVTRTRSARRPRRRSRAGGRHACWAATGIERYRGAHRSTVGATRVLTAGRWCCTGSVRVRCAVTRSTAYVRCIAFSHLSPTRTATSSAATGRLRAGG
jgi:large subunit ribosomal protein L15